MSANGPPTSSATTAESPNLSAIPPRRCEVAPDRMIAPVLPATLMACLLPIGKTSVAPTREFDS